MRRYKATITIEMEIEADNCMAADDFVKKFHFGGPSMSYQVTKSTKGTRRRQYWRARACTDSHPMKVKLEHI